MMPALFAQPCTEMPVAVHKMGPYPDHAVHAVADALQMEIWLSPEDAPVHAEIIYDGRRIVTMKIDHFQIL